MLNRERVPSRLEGDSVVLLCRELASGSASFADEMVLQVLVERKADRLYLVGAPDLFVKRVEDAAMRHGVAGAVSNESAEALGV